MHKSGARGKKKNSSLAPTKPNESVSGLFGGRDLPTEEPKCVEVVEAVEVVEVPAPEEEEPKTLNERKRKAEELEGLKRKEVEVLEKRMRKELEELDARKQETAELEDRVRKEAKEEEERIQQKEAEELAEQQRLYAESREMERQQKEIEEKEHQKFNLKVEKLVALINHPRDDAVDEAVEPEPSAAFGQVFSGEKSGAGVSNENVLPAPELIPLRALVEGGDMIIDATSSSINKVLIRYQVASQVLWSASRVFRRMFGPESQFKEAVDVRRAERGYGPAVIPLYDEPEALELILNTLHHHNDKLPDTIPFERMVEIAVICDKYELQCALRFVAEMWSRSLWSIDAGYEDWLLISWVFGYEDKFTQVSKELIKRSEWKTGIGLVFGNCKGDWGTMLSDATPEAVINKIAELRELHVNQLSKHIGKLKADRCGRHCQPLFCLFSKEECDAFQLGHLIQTLSKLDMERKEFWYQRCNCRVDSHSECSWVSNFKEYVRGVLDNVRGLNFADFPSRRVARVGVY